MNTGNEKVYLAADLGAGSGRVMAGVYNGKTLTLEECARFSNDPLELPDGIHWNIGNLYGNVRSGFEKALVSYGDRVVSAAVDTWGVDYALLDRRGAIMGLPYAYRDSRTNGMIERAEEVLPQSDVYSRTGIQSMFFNTLYQLLAEKHSRPEVMMYVDRLLFIPDLLGYWFTGEMANERSIASTSQLYNPAKKAWSKEILSRFDIPTGILGNFIDAGSVLGFATIGQRKLPIVSVCSHDTASAVAGAPLEGGNVAYLSSGTWSLLGVERKEPVMSAEAMKASFTNEVGYENSVRFLRNMSGFWIMQECRRQWLLEGVSCSYDELVNDAASAEAFTAVIDPDDEAFKAPGGMPQRVMDYLQKSDQRVPESRGELIRVVLESLALKYRIAVKELESVSGQKLEALQVVGGGCRNDLLNSLTASATGLTVNAGPVEATAIGNILVQMIADGAIGSLSEGRALVRESFPMKSFSANSQQRWEEMAVP